MPSRFPWFRPVVVLAAAWVVWSANRCPAQTPVPLPRAEVICQVSDWEGVSLGFVYPAPAAGIPL